MEPTDWRTRIKNVNVKSGNVRPVRQLLQDITKKKEWADDIIYGNFADARKAKTIGSPETPGFLNPLALTPNDPNEHIYVKEAATKLRSWIELEKNAWYNGPWILYPELLQWNIYQVIQLHRKSERRSKKNADHASRSHLVTTAAEVLDEVDGVGMAANSRKEVVAAERTRVGRYFDPVKDDYMPRTE